MAWSIVGVSAAVTVQTAAHSLALPSGTVDGDLLVAVFSTRIASTTSMTLASGWTLVGEAKNNNVLTTSSALPTATMAYIVRGASAPSLAFTHPAVPSQSIGQIVAYRGNAATTPLDAFTAVTTATAQTAVSVAGLTTTQADDLIVAMAAGGQEATWSNFNNVTTPMGASGTTDITTAPRTTGWIERADSSNTVGADGSLAIFDAVRTAAGATGNLTATASISAGHAVIAGAFKIYVPTVDGWNPADKSAGVTLSASDKTATFTTSADEGVRSTTTHDNGTAGKYYAEIIKTILSPNMGVTPTSNALNATTLNFNVRAIDGTIRVNNVVVGTSLGAFANGDVLGLAWDAGAKLVWFRKNGGSWNGSGSADPGSGSGGLDCSFAASTAHALWARSSTSSGAVVTVRTELAEYTQAIPSGFTSWMGETPAGGTPVTVSVTGQAVTAAVGDVTVSTPVAVGITVDLVGQAVTASVGPPTVTAATGISTLATGQTVTTAVGEVTATGKSNVSTIAAGQATTAGVGQVTVTATATVSTIATGQEVTSAVGQVSVSTVVRIDASVTAAGQEITAAAGEVSVTGKANVSTLLAGQAVTSAVGQVTVAAQIGVSVPIASETITSAVGTPSITTHARFTVTGQQVTSAVSFVTVDVGIGSSVLAASPQITATVGTPTFTTQQKFTITGQEVIASARGVSVSAGGSVSVTLSSGLATAAVGQVGVKTDHRFAITGTESTAAVGQVTVDARQTVSNTVVGQSLAVTLGTVTVTAGGSVSVLLAGQSLAPQVGSVSLSLGIGATVPVLGQEIAAGVGEIAFLGSLEGPMPGMQANVGAVTVTIDALRGMDVWTGIEWARKPTKVWTGSVWLEKPVKVWDGSAWL